MYPYVQIINDETESKAMSDVCKPEISAIDEPAGESGKSSCLPPASNQRYFLHCLYHLGIIPWDVIYFQYSI